MQEIENNEAYADADYVLIADLDGTNNLIDQKGIDSCFSNDTWAACTLTKQVPITMFGHCATTLGRPTIAGNSKSFYKTMAGVKFTQFSVAYTLA